jgi:Protein of unknown function (DUF3617)
MSLSRSIVLGLAAGASIFVVVHAQDIVPHLKPGLWQTTASVQTAGGLPMSDADLAQLPPDKRAQFEAAMKAAIAQSAQPHTFTSCLTAERLRKDLAFNFESSPACKRTVVSSSASHWEMHEECTGASQRTVTARFQATSPGEITGETEVTMTKGGRKLTSRGSVHSKWLGSDCGNVKRDADIQQPGGR